MPKTETYTLEPAPGMKSGLVGLFLAQLDDQNKNLTDDTRGATPEELAWQAAPGMNTIGMLLAHIALVEVGWIGAAAVGLDFFKIDELPVKWADSGIPLAAGAAPPAALRGKDLAFYDDVLSRARAFTWRALAPLADADLARQRSRIRRDGTEVHYSVRWALYHVLEHEAGHYGQINLLRHQYRLAHARV
ncbi:MAG: DUF664 domain-containing protein [Candidatus Eisenbacteria bacterium]|uniref:DUF664 domain-containing protein n=1 Tax=Eiseniibacteriota bacterium TaxID=2212470 RepID=A0A538SE30_UNCEI|nr:MAG: DUF664 domain-containing protein [Candidatus Eisenbacteria bacterium]